MGLGFIGDRCDGLHGIVCGDIAEGVGRVASYYQNYKAGVQAHGEKKKNCLRLLGHILSLALNKLNFRQDSTPVLS